MKDEADMPAEEGEGMSTGKKVIAGAALGVAVPAAVGVARKLLSDDDDGGDDGGSRSRRSAGSRPRSTATSRARSSGTRKTASRSKTSSSARAKSATTAARSSGGTARTKTREQLYRQATRLKIDGRSSMTKAQLERAVARAKAK